MEWETYDSAGDGKINHWFIQKVGPNNSRFFASVDPHADEYVVTVGWTSSTELAEYSSGAGLTRFTLERIHKHSDDALITAKKCLEFLLVLAESMPDIVSRAQSVLVDT